MTWLKLLALCLLALAASGCSNPELDVWLMMDDHYKWQRFHANFTLELNYGNAFETVKTNESISVTPRTWNVFCDRPIRNVTEVESITFEYKSVDSPKDKFALDAILLGQNIYRGRYLYTRNLVLNVTGWLEQNTVYTGVPWP